MHTHLTLWHSQHLLFCTNHCKSHFWRPPVSCQSKASLSHGTPGWDWDKSISTVMSDCQRRSTRWHCNSFVHAHTTLQSHKVWNTGIRSTPGNDGWVAPAANTREVANLDRYIADVARDIDNLATQEDTESWGTFSSYLAGRKYLSLHYWHSTTINLPVES